MCENSLLPATAMVRGIEWRNLQSKGGARKPNAARSREGGATGSAYGRPLSRSSNLRHCGYNHGSHQSMNARPYVSFVTWGRNDGYTPDYRRRVDRAAHYLAAQLDRAGIDSEIVFVEWNPVPDRPLLLD